MIGYIGRTQEFVMYFRISDNLDFSTKSSLRHDSLEDAQVGARSHLNGIKKKRPYL